MIPGKQTETSAVEVQLAAAAAATNGITIRVNAFPLPPVFTLHLSLTPRPAPASVRPDVPPISYSSPSTSLASPFLSRFSLRPDNRAAIESFLAYIFSRTR